MRVYRLIATAIMIVFIHDLAAQMFDNQIGVPLQLGQFRNVFAMTRDASGNLYVVDDISNIITKFDPNGTPLLSWGTIGAGDGQFGKGPGDIKAAPNGNIYVVDGGNNRVQIFSSNGTFISKFGTKGTGDGQLIEPPSMAIDAGGYVYLCEGAAQSRIQKFTAGGSFVTKWGSLGSGDGQINAPWGIGVDPNGDVYVVEVGNARIQKFTNTGTFITKWGGAIGSVDGQFAFPTSIDFLGANVYVADASNSRIQVFTNSGTFVSKWTVPRRFPGTPTFPLGMAVDPAGNIFVGNWLEIDKFNAAGILQSKLSTSFADAQFSAPRSLQIDASDNIHVLDNFRIQKFNNAGIFVGTLVSPALPPPTDGQPNTIKISPAGELFASMGQRILKFSANGAVAVSWGNFGVGAQQIVGLADLAFDNSGNVYVLDPYNDPPIKKFAADGSFIASWGTTGTGNGQFTRPARITIDIANNIYIADAGNNRIQKFTTSGTFITAWGTTGTSNGQFDSPADIVIDNLGNVLVLDLNNQRIQKFDNAGNFLSKWDRSVFAPNVAYMLSIAMNSDGTLYIADPTNQRVEKFVFQNTISSFSPSSGAPGTEVVITGTNFSKTLANNIVKFNGTAAVVTASTPTSLTVTVPAGAATGSITVTVAGQTSTSNVSFSVPVVTGLESGLDVMHVWPNPFSDRLVVEFAAQDEYQPTSRIEIFNSLGVAVHSTSIATFTTPWMWECADQSSGLYFIKFSRGGQSTFRRVIKR